MSGELQVGDFLISCLVIVFQCIVASVQTADPDNQGGEWLNLGIGLRFTGQNGQWLGHSLGFEYLNVISQHVNGVQLEMQNMINIGYQYAF